MRLVTLAVTYLTITLLTMAACPASANEAFIAQLTSKAAATEPSSANSTKTVQSAAMLALRYNRRRSIHRLRTQPTQRPTPHR